MEFAAIYDALAFFGHRWTIEILASLAERPKRFTDLQRSINLVHAKTFVDALRRLEDHGLITHPHHGDGTHYALTPEGRRILPLIVAFVDDLRWWGRANDNEPSPTATTD